MASLKRQVIRFSQAASASGLKAKTLRNWLDRGAVTLISDRAEGWQDFSYADIAMLSLMAEMIGGEVPISVAGGIARALIQETGLMEGAFDLPANILLAPFTNKLLLIWVEDAVARYALISEGDFFKKPHSTRTAMIVLRPAFIINNAFLSIEEDDTED